MSVSAASPEVRPARPAARLRGPAPTEGVEMELLREINLRIYELVRRWDGPGEFFCECGQPACRPAAIIRLHVHEFADVLALRDCFALAPGHQPANARVVCEYPAYVV